MGYNIGRFKGQQKSHIILNDGIDKNYTKCSGEYRKDYEIVYLAGKFNKEGIKHIGCKKCKMAAL
jgi:hypothetical protein